MTLRNARCDEIENIKLLNKWCSVRRCTFGTHNTGPLDSVFKKNGRFEISVAQIPKTSYMICDKVLLQLSLNYQSVGIKYPLWKGLDSSRKKENFSNSWENIWTNRIWTVLGYLMPTTLPLPLSKNIRKSFVVRVNRQCYISQCELLLQTVLIGQSTWRGTLRGRGS